MMLATSFCKFLRDEDGSYTIWSLVWFSLYVAMGGLAVDITDAYRTQSLLQSTADSAALAAVMSLPGDTTDAVNQAVAFAEYNMVTSINGNVLAPGDVIFGDWNFDTSIFATGGATPRAARVITRRGQSNANPLATNFLRIIGLQQWNIAVEAIAVKYIPECLQDGLHARGMVDISSNNKFIAPICVHGQDHVEVQNNNDWEPGVRVSMPSLKDMPQMETRIKPSKNPGLAGALSEADLDPKMVDQVPMIINTLLNPATDTGEVQIVPTYITNPEIILLNDKSDISSLAVADAVLDDGPGRIYHVVCNSNKSFSIPKDLIFKDMVIVSDCNISVGNSLLTNVTLASTGGNGKVGNANIGFSSGARLGLADNCASGGGVRLFTTASIHSAAKMQINGVQMVAMGDIHISAGADGANGIAAQAGGDIKVTSNNVYGICGGGVDGIFTAWYYRLVR